jgi:microcystin-dependent protein
MSPSSVNDSARAMMARLAEFRKDYGGIVTTGGSATAYTLTTNQGDFTDDAAGDGFVIGFIPHTTNTGTATINVDGQGAQPLRQFTGTALNSGALVAGSAYRAVWRNSTTEFLLLSSYPSQFEVPLGALLPYTGSTAPNANFVIPIGQCLSRTTYATYFALVSTTFGTCADPTEFAMPDMRGRVVAGTDALGASLAGRLNTTGGMSSAANGAVGGTQTHTLTAAQMPTHTHTITVTDPGHEHDMAASTASATETNAGTTMTLASGNNIYRAVAPNTTLRAGTVAETTTGITAAAANAGSGSAHPNVQPTLMTFWILRVR